MQDIKRSTLTLGFKKTKKNDETSISLSSREMLAQRQKELKEKTQLKKNAALIQKKEFIKKNNEDKKDEIKESNDTKIISESQKKNDVIKENNNKKDFNTKFKKDNRGNYKKDHNKDTCNKEKNTNYSKDKQENINSTGKDNIRETKEIKKQIEKPVEKENFNQKKSSYKDIKAKEKNSYEDDSAIDRLNRKISKDKNEKYSKSIHTYIFHEDGDLANIKYNSNKTRKKEKRLEQQHIQQKIYQIVNIPDFISVADLADRMNEKKADIIKKLLTMGMKTTANQILDADTAELIVVEFGHTPNRVSDSDIENILKENQGTNFVARSPVVTVMGHVDHGKTSLLDALRTTKVAEGESGGITQHIGASRIEVDKDKFITFIDTPGHEAFTEMRMRGANITDIVVLVVAADDGVKDQTIEAIHHTKAANVPMIVAINKIDKIGAEPEKVKQELLQYNVVSEDFGGDVMFVEVSAKNRINLNKLIDAILLQAEILDLKAPIDCNATGAVIESRVDSQKGVITSVLVQNGILKIGDIVLAGTSYGRVKKMVDDKRKTQDEVYPSMAVEILGLSTTPSAGDVFNVVATEKEARDIIAYRENKEREAKEAKRAGKTVESMLQQVKGSNKKQLSIILKCDVSGSIEAIDGSLFKLNSEEARVDIIHSAIGAITESDINLAIASNAIIIAFNVRASSNIKDLAKEKGVEIKYYSIIYNIIDDVRAIMSGLLDPIMKEKILGQAEIRNVIKISGIGKIAGCYVIDGEIRRNANVRLVRDSIVIFDGRIKALRRFKDDVKEVKNNYECGISIEAYDDIKEKDIIECYEIVEEKRVVNNGK